MRYESITNIIDMRERERDDLFIHDTINNNPWLTITHQILTIQSSLHT